MENREKSVRGISSIGKLEILTATGRNRKDGSKG